MGKRKLFMLYQLTLASEGDIAEIGVYRGGSSYLMAKTALERTIYSLDTFEGMPETDPKYDFHKSGDFADIPSDTISWLSSLPNIRVCKGLFPDETAKAVSDNMYGLVHIDVDIYKSVKDCLEFFYPRTRAGGFLVSDDYGAITTRGAKVAWDEFFSDKPETTIYLPTGQCFVIKK